jgi:hypothetical protein
MRRGLVILAAALCIAPSGQAASLRSMVAAEYAFAKSADDNGMRFAFIEYLADDAISFEPGPVRIRLRWQERPPRKDSLTWHPVRAEINAAGDLGFTTGPYTYTMKGSGNVAHGDFITVWRYREPDGWRVVFDSGVVEEAPRKPAAPLKAESVSARVPPNVAADATAQSALESCDDRYGVLLKQHGEAAALAGFGRRDLSVYVVSQAPAEDRKAALKVVAGFTEPQSQRRSFAGSGASPDFGYTYGDVEFLKPGPQHYLRIWRMKAGRCELALELLHPQQPKP